ncbi:restriction endonuclease subunit S [Tabrizicola fusiformis]|uniref:restriction endonuclease subunit S n=1 Tax=Tabrizicola sp. SY72 TaxID=2741673 RepID=UPI001573DB2C|nr:restriction endonuclease subunit S [Tabrizicola sp. SY72]
MYGSNGIIGASDKKNAAAGTIVVGRVGTYCGSIYLAKTDCWVTDNAIKAVTKNDNDPRYIFFLLGTLGLNNLRAGSGQPLLNQQILSSIPVTAPTPLEQRAIAATLGALDDKIELNRKMNATLEAMARALFRDWFVDFGPTRAKMEARAPYLSPDLWPLFPARLDDDGKPEGWAEKPLDQIADFLNGLALQKFPAESDTDSLAVIKIAELRNGVTANSNRASRKVPPQYVVQDRDFLFSWSGSLLAKFWTGGEGALNQHLFKVTSDRYPAWFYSEWVQHHLDDFQVIAASKATTMGHIQRGHLKAAKTICPPDHVIARLGEVVAPLIARIVGNELASRTLAQTRDLLLPRLMSGEVRVAEAERLLETTI